MIARLARVISTLLVLIVLAPIAHADGPSFALRVGKAMPVSDDLPWVIEHAVIIVRDGRIESIGQDLEIPPDLTLIDMPDATVMPGLVAASSGLAGERTGPESVSAAYRAADSFDLYADFRTTLAHGVTTAHLNPGWRRLMSGQGAVVKLAGPAGARVLDEQADLTINVGPAINNPPPLMNLLIPPSATGQIEPSTPQRPDSRLGQYLALKEAIEKATTEQEKYDEHMTALADRWNGGARVRVQSQRADDLLTAISFLTSHKRKGYLVGGQEAALVANEIRAARLPLVYTIDAGFDGMRDIGANPDALAPDIHDLAQLPGIPLALALPEDAPLREFRLAATTALRAGLTPKQVVEAITRTPAEILGVSDRVGSLETGKDADLLVLSGDPLATSSHVLRVYVDGRLVYKPQHEATVVRAETIWLGPDDYLDKGSILVEDGKITAVGRTVPHPPGAIFVDAGEGSFVAPGFIDSFGHLGLGGDDSALSPDLTLARLVGAPGVPEERVARAGVTTVITAPRRFNSNGSQFSAIKTAGHSRDDRVVAETAAVAFDVSDMDPADVDKRIRGRLEAGKAYLEKWEKWRTDLAEWEKKRAEGKVVDTKPKVEEIKGSESKEDPLTGTWQVKVTGGPLPEAIEGPVGINLDGDEFEGRLLHPQAAEIEHRIYGTLDGMDFQGTLEVDTGGLGFPTFSGTIEEEDFFTGQLGFQGLSVNLEGRRTDRSAVEFKVKSRKRRTTGKDGIPLPPRKDDALEPIRALLEKRIPAVVKADTSPQIKAVLDLLVDEYELPVVLLDAPGAIPFAEKLAEKDVGVVVPKRIVTRRDHQEYNVPDALSRLGVPVAFQSNAEDGARGLPMAGLYAVERGMSADQALAAFTTDAAKLYKLEDRLGAIKPGAEGDLVIYTGHPFQAGSSLKRVIVGGQTVYNAEVDE